MVLNLNCTNIPADQLGIMMQYFGTDFANIQTDVNANTAQVATNVSNIATNAANIGTGVTNNVTYANYKNYANEGGYDFDGVTSYLYADDLVTQMVATWNDRGALMIDYMAPNTLAAGCLFSGNDTSADEKIQINVTATGEINCICTVAGVDQWEFTTDNPVITANNRFSIMLVQNATVPYLYVNRSTPDITFATETDKTAWFHDTTAVDNFRVMCDSVGGAGNANFAQGSVYRIIALTDVPSLSEAYALNMGGVVPKKWRAATNAQYLDEADLATHAKWTPGGAGDWVDTGGNLAFTFATGNDTVTQADTDRLVAGKDGERMLLVYTATEAVAPDGDLAVTLTNAFAETAVTLSTTAGTHYYRFLTAPGANTGDFVIDVTSTTATVGTFTFDDFNLVHIGAVANLDFRGLNHKQWHDIESGLWVVSNSASVFGLPADHQEKYLMTAITGDTSAEIVPAGYRLDNIIVLETAGNAITGGLKIGTAAGGTQVVNAEAIGGNAFVDCTLVINIFSATAAQTLCIEDVTAWNAASINLWFIMTRYI